MSSFRPIDTAGFEKPARRDLGAKPTLQWIPIADLVVDETYQRRISAEGVRAVKRIVSEFDWTYFSPVIVAPIEGRKFAIIDGQHRTTAARVVGIAEVPCLLVLADPRQQAAAFAAINGKVQRASAMQIFHAAKTAGEAWAVGVAEVADAAGVVILRYPMAATLPERPRHSTMSAKTIERIIARYGRDLAIRALRCITQSSLGDDPAVLGHLWMRAIASALFEHGMWDRQPDALLRFFDDLDAGAAVKSSVAHQGPGVSASEALAIVLRTEMDAQQEKAA